MICVYEVDTICKGSLSTRDPGFFRHIDLINLNLIFIFIVLLKEELFIRRWGMAKKDLRKSFTLIGCLIRFAAQYYSRSTQHTN
jgi:hypothetical protein